MQPSNLPSSSKDDVGVATSSSAAPMHAVATSPIATARFSDGIFPAGQRIMSRPTMIRRRRSLARRTATHNLPSTNLYEKLAGDVLVAAGVTLAVSPFMVVVDKAIVQRAAGTHTVLSSAATSLSSLLRSPVQFVKSPMFLMMWAVYGATYSTANSLKTLAEHSDAVTRRTDEEEAWKRRKTRSLLGVGRPMISNNGTNSKDNSMDSAKWGSFMITTAVNSASSMMKDKAYAQMFGSTGSATKMPLVTYGCWAARDFMVIGSSFVLPDIVGGSIQDSTGLPKKDALAIAQFACPVFTQFIVGPIQLLGLDFYNRPMQGYSFGRMVSERAKLLGQNFSSVVAARVARIAPAYGIGGIGNTYLRGEWRSFLIKREVRKALEKQDVDDRRRSAQRLVDLVAPAIASNSKPSGGSSSSFRS